MDGTKTFPEKWRLLISLPGFHSPQFDCQVTNKFGELADKHITSLDEYLEAVFIVFQRCIARGAIGIKDQSAYWRTLAYELPTKS